MPSTPNAPERLHWTVELLDVAPSDHLLEIGCGAGYAISLVCDRLRRGTITAIDRSATMVARARARNAEAVASGRARIEQQPLEQAALGRRFPKVFAVNVNACWTRPAPSLAALRQLLEPAGRAYLIYEPPSAARLRELERMLPAHLDSQGFRVTDVRVQEFRRGQGLGVIASPG